MFGIGWRGALAAAMVIVVSACGGGGGGEGGVANPGGQPPGSPLPTSLMPAAPVPGETLFADATVLRPLLPDAIWRYRGVQTQANVALPTVYDTSTHHLSAGAGRVFETATNVGNLGADQVTLRVESGTVTADEGLDLAPGSRIVIPRTELKSPVRAGEQYNIYDRRIEDIGADIDGDKRNDALDIAVYARVVGLETVALPSLPSVRAVRVDTTLLTRVRGSVTNTWTDVTRIETKSWYAEGIGLVQQQSDVPALDAKGATRTVESLVAFEGENTGYGAGQAVAVRVPLTSATFPGEAVSAATVVAAVPIGDQALLFADRSADGLTVYRMNATGSITGVQHHLGLNNQPRSARYLRVGDEVVAVGGFGPAMRRFNASGEVVGTVTTLPLSRPGRSDGSVLGAAAYGQTLGLLWQRVAVDGTKMELVMGRFALDGSAVGSEVVLFSGSYVNRSTLATSGGRLVATWTAQEWGIGPFEMQVAAWAPETGALKQTVLATGLQSTFPFVPAVVPLEEGAALLWARQLSTGETMDESAGVRLDAQFDLVRGAATLEGESIRDLPGSRANGNTPTYQSQGRRILAVVSRAGPIWPDVPSYPGARSQTLLSWWDVGTGPLNGAQVRTMRVGVDSVAFDRLQTMVPFGDRWLLLGGDIVLTVRKVWLQPAGR